MFVLIKPTNEHRHAYNRRTDAGRREAIRADD